MVLVALSPYQEKSIAYISGLYSDLSVNKKGFLHIF